MRGRKGRRTGRKGRRRGRKEEVEGKKRGKGNIYLLNTFTKWHLIKKGGVLMSHRKVMNK